MIINHEHPEYKKKWIRTPENSYNGAFYYSKEICELIIPRIKTDRNWITINIKNVGIDHSIVFIHNNLHPENYDWLKQYDDLILVCGIPETVEKVKHLGKALYLPLSVDVQYVEQFKKDVHNYDTAFVGRPSKKGYFYFPDSTEFIEGIPRHELLQAMSEFKWVYAVGRTAIEARILDCEVLPYDDRFPDPSIWKILDSRDAAIILQNKLDELEKNIMDDKKKEVYYAQWCPGCKNYLSPGDVEPCNSCLTQGWNIDSHKPINFKEI